MADDELRELERRWLGSGALEDGVRWHRARLRSGQVDRDGLRREAAGGDRAAWAALDDVPPLLIRFDDWLRAHAPMKLAGFHPPAREADLAETEATLGQPLPSLLQGLYLWRDGQPPGYAFGVVPEEGDEEAHQNAEEYHANEALEAGFDFDPPQEDQLHLEVWPGDWRMLSLREVRSAWEARVRQPVVRDGEEAPNPWPPACVPFMVDDDGKLRCVDPTGARTGTPGQVVEGTDGIERIVAPSLERWLEVLVVALEREVWKATDAEDAKRVDYFARAVTPGFPLEVAAEEVRPERAPYDETAGDLVETTGLCSGCFSCLACGPTLFIALGVAVWRQGTDAFSWSLVEGGAKVSLGVLLVSLAIAIPFAISMFVDARRKHREYTEEFASARLEDDEPPRA